MFSTAGFCVQKIASKWETITLAFKFRFTLKISTRARKHYRGHTALRGGGWPPPGPERYARRPSGQPSQAEVQAVLPSQVSPHGPPSGKWVQRGLVQKGGPLWYGSLARQWCFFDDLGSLWEKNNFWNFWKLMTGNFRRFGDILCILLSFSIVILATAEYWLLVGFRL